MIFKRGVSIANVKPEVVLGIMICRSVVDGLARGAEYVITSCTDGKHSPKSKHYLGYAFDFRTREFSDGLIAIIAAECQRSLGEQFDVVVEKTHIHIEFDPEF